MMGYLKKAVSFAISEPSRVPAMTGHEVNNLARRCNQVYHQFRNNPNGYDLIGRDWDTAIILDACRYDYFENRERLKRGSLRRETAPGAESQEFIERCFKGREIHDTVYVTGNPYTTIIDPETFHKIYLDEAWEGSANEVPADRVTDVALKAHENHPNKRIIVHYMQPHLPILHPEEDHINDAIKPIRGQYWPVDTTMDALKRAYAANLEYVLEHVEKLVDQIDGKVVVTADHGELLGERESPIPVRGTEHHPGLYVEELVEVPWLTIESGTRREIVEDPPEGELDVDEETKRDRLHALGYI